MADKPMPFFVYGTLRMGGGLARSWDGDVNRVERHLVVRGYQLYVTHGGFPYAVADPDPDKYVLGDLLWPDGDEKAGTLTKRFDGIEGHPNHYTRTEVAVTRNARETEKAWMYAVTLDRISMSGWTPPQCIGSSWIVYEEQRDRERQAQTALMLPVVTT